MIWMRRIGRIGRSESLGAYGDWNILEIRMVRGSERLGRSEILAG
jgi:hypothetical protein